MESFSGPRAWLVPPHPLPRKFVKPVEDVGFEGLKYHGVCTLHLAVGSWVSNGGLVDLNAVVVAELEEFLPGEECAIVGNYGVRDSKSVYDVEEEFHHVFGSYSCYRFSFDPLGELVDHHQKVGVAPGCFPDWPEQVVPIGREWPC